jgi:hypothetical protein
MRIPDDVRRLEDLRGVGPATGRDFELLGVRSVVALARADPQELYDRLCVMTSSMQDPCVLDVFSCTVAQARNPRLPAEQCHWHWWSRKRKAMATKASAARPRTRP